MSKVITATTKATKSLVAAAVALSKQAAELETFTKIQADVAFDIECKQSELGAIEQELEDNKRRAAAELSLAILENEDEQLSKLMESRGLAHVTGSELNAITSNLEAALADNSEAIKSAVNSALETQKAANDLAMQQKESEHQVATATKNASITSLESRNNQLAEQVTQLREQISAEREARVSIAASDAAGRIQVAGVPA